CGITVNNTVVKKILIVLSASRSGQGIVSVDYQRQLELAVAWNRVDIANTEIFTDESQWKSEQLHNAMFSALVGNKPEFVSLLLENGVSLRDFLQEETLCELYRQLPNCLFLRRLAKRATSSQRTRRPFKEKPPDLHRNPESDLFLWAILHNNRALAEITWEECQDCMAAALAASKILKKLAEEDKDADEAEEMKELAKLYEKRAMDVFSECYSCDEERAQKLLARVSPFWGRTTCLRMALEANNQSFVAQSGVQALLTQIWCGELSVENPVWRVLLCLLFFPLIYIESSQDVELKPLDGWARLVSLYTSPQVKFFMNIVSYFAFLTLFAVVLMVDFQTTPSGLEILLYIWLFSLVCEEIRQVKMYINDVWNILDVLSIILFIFGLVFRLSRLIDGLFYAGKILLCIDFIVFCLRLMAIFTISRTLGPKIIIVKRMMMDMFFFMFLLSIWVVAYGVAKQSILIHNEDRLGWILRGAVYEPYLTIFGDMPKNIDNTDFDINLCSMNGSDPLKPKCPMLNEQDMPAFPEWLTILMLCVYLLFANILLLNLLIAIFNFTFQEVQDNTDRIWKFQRYELIKEYYSRPAAPPPLILLSHLYMFLRSVVLRRASNPWTDFSEFVVWAQRDLYFLILLHQLSGSLWEKIRRKLQKHRK
uniref:Uncharacterized protein n=1 Tax=Periophthalmus magnuspinnatus TaxID=409849 RepID=A0A3B3ZW62_9GOBI